MEEMPLPTECGMSEMQDMPRCPQALTAVNLKPATAGAIGALQG